ncbi:MAG TPA: HD domain-containing protein [Candidatus Udaeobacter sp.]|nr:HD domain-containing protein [Candidatus Udaeobacter sp.]
MRIKRRFGDVVANIVDECTDAYTIPKPPWKDRKEKYIEHIAHASKSTRLVSASDKLHNARSIQTLNLRNLHSLTGEE